MLGILRAILNGLVVVFIFALLALGICTMALQFPSVQTYAVGLATSNISEKLGYPVNIERVNIKWFDVVSLEGVSVLDTNQKDMIRVGRIDVNLNLDNIVQNSAKEIRLDEVNVYQPNVKMKVVPGGGRLNLDGFIDKIAELTAPEIPRPENAPENNTPFVISKSRVIDGTFSYDDPREPHIKNPRVFDYYHFELKNIHGDLKNFLIQGDTIAFHAKNLHTVDRQTGLKMHELTTDFLFSQKRMELKNLDAHIGKSHLRDEIIFAYNRSGELGDFNHKVFLKGHLVGSYVSSTDLGLFSSYIDAMDENWLVSGDFNGKVDDFVLSNADLRFGKDSRIVGDLGFKGLPRLEGIQMDLKLAKSKIVPEDIVKYYPEWESHETLAKFGTTILDGSFKGTLSDFNVKGNAETELGQLGCDLAFQIRDDQATTYIGSLKTVNFELGKLLDDEKNYQLLDFDGNITGKGLTLAYASTRLDGAIGRIGFRGYDYEHITVNGNLQKQYFNGNVSVRDSNLVLNVDGEFDLTKERNYFDVKGAIQRANLGELGFTKDSITLKSDLDFRISGNSIDELTGEAKLLNTSLVHTHKDRNLVIDTLLLSSKIGEGKREITLGSEFLTARLEGDFLPTKTWKDLSQLLEEYRLYFIENETNRNEYYATKPKQLISNRYQIDYEVETRNIASLLAFLSPDVYLSKGAKAEGMFKMDNTAFLTFNMKADTMRYGKSQFVTSEVDVTTSKFVNSAEVLASAFVTSDNQQIKSMVPTEGMELEGTWDQDHIDFNGAIQQVKSSNKADLGGEIRFLEEGLNISFKNSRLSLLDEEWNMPANSLISVRGIDMYFSNVGLISGKQRLALNGFISDNPDKSLKLEITNFKLNSINPVFDVKLGGIMDGRANIRDVYNGTELDASCNIESLGYGGYEFGNFEGSGEWDQNEAELLVDAHLNKDLRRVFDLTGYYRPSAKTNTLKMKAIFNRVDFKALEPFAEGYVSDIGGTAQGTVLISGEVTAPVLEGSLMVENGKMKFDYLQSVFTFSDKINFTESEISVNNMLLTDEDGNTARVRGGVFHDGFKYFSLGFNADLRSFKILNTTAKDNSMFYGTAYVTGPVSVYGPFNNLNIEANATSNKGTRIFIPLDGATEVQTQDYIQFVSKMPKVTRAEGDTTEQIREVGGIKMDFNFNITPDATCEIIFDRQTGDIIRGIGSGRINLNIDTEGDFKMAGTYEIDKGDYNFTLQNVINKKFTIKPGSRIIWSGDPYGAQLDVKAGYTQSVSLLGVLPNQTTSTSGGDVLSRRYPVEVTIGLSDRLMSPQIKYDLRILDSPTLSSSNYQGYLEAFQNKLKTDEQELSRQVTSLLVMNQLLPETSLSGQTATGTNFLGNSLSELVSNQISRWASEINENLEVGVSGLSLDQNALNNLQLRFSYRFLNDRFRVTRDGRISNGTVGGTTQYDAASLIGEWTLEYWLNPKGSVRIKAYNRNVQNSFYFSTVTTGGMSMQFTHSFNRFIPLGKPGLRIPFLPADSIKHDSTSGKLISTKTIKDSK